VRGLDNDACLPTGKPRMMTGAPASGHQQTLASNCLTKYVKILVGWSKEQPLQRRVGQKTQTMSHDGGAPPWPRIVCYIHQEGNT
jgi:hypothetical protein